MWGRGNGDGEKALAARNAELTAWIESGEAEKRQKALAAQASRPPVAPSAGDSSFATLLRLTNQTVASLADILRGWMKNPLLKSTEITVTIPVGGYFGEADHGLGRTMNGAFVVGVDGGYMTNVLLTNSPKKVYVFCQPVVSAKPLHVKVRVY